MGFECGANGRGSRKGVGRSGLFVPLSVIDRTGAPPESEGINRRDR